MNDEVFVGAREGAPYRVQVTSVSHISARRFAEILSAIKTTLCPPIFQFKLFILVNHKKLKNTVKKQLTVGSNYGIV